MSQFRPDQKRRAPRGLLAVALLGAGAAVFASPGPAVAQETGSLLRGEVSEADVNNDLLSGVPLLEQADPAAGKPKDDDGIPSPTFEPASSGATPDLPTMPSPSAGATAAERSIFQSNDGDDVFADEPPPAPAGRPTTAGKRVSDARQKAGRPQDPAAERLAAKKKQEAKPDEEDPAPPARFASGPSTARPKASSTSIRLPTARRRSKVWKSRCPRKTRTRWMMMPGSRKFCSTSWP